jgi:hypothetical protein
MLTISDRVAADATAEIAVTEHAGRKPGRLSQPCIATT